MPSPTPTEKQKLAIVATLRETIEVSSHIRESIEALRQSAGRPPFVATNATTQELLDLTIAIKPECRKAVMHQIAIYLGQCLIDEFQGHWSMEKRPHYLYFMSPYVDGFGNVDAENVYLPQLRLEWNVEDFARFRARCRRAYDLRAKFTSIFGHLAGSSMLQSDLEHQCVALDVLPTGSQAKEVWRERVKKYAKLLKIKLRRE